MKAELNEITINDTVYVPKDSVTHTKAESFDGMDYVIVRTYSAGVFAGYLEQQKGKEVVLKQARRLWYWKGAASLSQLAMEGVGSPSECKFPIEVDSITLTEAIETLFCTERARISIKEVPIWKA